jgi:hypothetical protein
MLFHESHGQGDHAFLRLGESEIPAFARPSIPLRIVLPPSDVDSDDYWEFVEPNALFVPVRVVDAGTGAELTDVPLRLVSAKSGLGVWSEDEIDEETDRMAVRVSPGVYHVLPGDPFAAHRIISPETVLVEPGRKAPIVTKAASQPVLELAGVPEDSSEFSFTLCVPGASVAVEPVKKEAVHLPPDVPAVVRVERGHSLRFFPVGPIEEGRRKAHVDCGGMAPEPEGGDGERPEVGPVRVLDAAGKPVVGRGARIERRYRTFWGNTDEEGLFVKRRGSGRASGRSVSLPEPFVAPPFFLTVDGYVPKLVQVTAPGEQTVRMPPGALDISVTSDGGKPLDFAYSVDGMGGKGLEGRLLLRGVEPGRRTLVLDAPNHAARLVLVDVPETGVKPIAVVLGRE